ncbi:hypothetical protein [Arthrobacter nitrophenolicus]|uniref:Uncharacterized protein n=1 Tax=Arthrobacter nitrophenolicus TaxID=683150 RepID=A0ACC6TDD0_9MICC|nr:hypothetical protein [Arthrobacter nitrophenolicus]
MSEILQEEVVDNENGVSRRRVVAGVAWSLPVIATAIAAPAAAASGTLSLALGQVGSITFTKQGVQGQGQIRHGQGPANLDIQNTTGIAQTITVGIVPAVNSGSVRAGIAIKALDGATVLAPVFDAAYISTASITIAGDQLVSRGVSFQYVEGNGQSAPIAGQVYTFTMTITGTSITPLVIPNITMTI